MRNIQFSIRTTLLSIIGVLNLFIAVLVGFNLYKSWHEHRGASALSQNLAVSNLLYNTEKFLSSERGTAVSVLYAPPNVSGALMQELLRSRKNANASLDEALETLADDPRDDLKEPVRLVRESYGSLQKLRRSLDTALMLHTASMLNRDKSELSLPDQFFKADTDLIMKLDDLIEIYNRPFSLLNAAAGRQMRFTHLIWGVTEYAGREYALIGKYIAENQKLTPQDQERLQAWRGRIQYGWELAHSSSANNSWGKKIEPAMNGAEDHYFMTFNKLKALFYAPHKTSSKNVYSMNIETWLDVASQAVASLHGLNDSVLQVNRDYIEDIKHESERSITISLILFIVLLFITFYSWRMITLRVIRPVNLMADNLYKATKGERFEIPDIKNHEDEIGKLLSALKVFQNNARDLEIERDKAKAANIAKSEFLANMSHEIRTPMNVVIGLSNILSTSKPLTDRQREFIKTLQLSASSLLSIINDLLDIAKIETEKYELEIIPFNLADLIEEIITIMSVKAGEKGLQFKIDLAGIQNREYLGDPTRIRQVLTNLCGNAIKFTEEGQISLKVQGFQNPNINIEDLYITVEDTGIGISGDNLDTIFDKFTQADSSITRKYGGTGLGLTITKTLVEMMNGTIGVESSPGTGTIFTVHLPLKFYRDVTGLEKPAQVVISNGDDMSPVATNDNACVLLVEDYQPNALVASLYLEQFGFNHDIAENGTIALRKFKENDYHAILMDVQMHGLDGYQTTQEIRRLEKEAHKPRIKIIGMTAHALPGDREKCLDAGMDDYLSKPFNPDDLRDKLSGKK